MAFTLFSNYCKDGLKGNNGQLDRSCDTLSPSHELPSMQEIRPRFLIASRLFFECILDAYFLIYFVGMQTRERLISGAY